jgi:signal transduction histidine kinase
MTRLYQVGKEISADLELVPRLDVIAAKAAELSGSRAAVLYLRIDDSDEFRPASSSGVDLPALDENEASVMGKADDLWAAVEKQQAVHIHAGSGDDKNLPGVPGAQFEQQLAVPMIAEGDVMGVLVLLDKENGFTDDDEKFLALFASQSAIAVRNSQLFDHTKSLDRLKSEFVAVVSHEIRTPLTSVKGAVELLSDEKYFQNNEQQTKLLTIAHANTERLLVLINDILDFSKLEAASLPMCMERQRLEPIVQQATHNLRTQLEQRQIKLKIVVASDLPDLMIDGNRVTQVLTNLLSNAIKFSPQGGQIEVTAEPWEWGVRVGVLDQGEGIRPQDQPKLFRKFSQIDSSATRHAGGTGLGLVICKGIVGQHGGEIWVESTVAEGSSFYFTLPRVEKAAEAYPSEQAS